MRNSTWDSSISPQNSVQCLYLFVFFIFQLFYSLEKIHEIAEGCASQIFWDWQCLGQWQLFNYGSWPGSATRKHSPKGPVFLYHMKLKPKISVYAAWTQRSYHMASCPKVFWLTGYKLYFWWASDSLTRFSGKTLLTSAIFSMLPSWQEDSCH